MYIATATCVCGLALLADSAWVLLAGLAPALLYLQLLVIPWEERELERVFGQQYRAKVRGWVGEGRWLQGGAPVTEGMGQCGRPQAARSSHFESGTRLQIVCLANSIRCWSRYAAGG